MTQKDLIKAEIERLKKELEKGNYYLDSAEAATGYELALDDLLSFIDSLPEEPVSEDLEEAKEAYCNEHNDDCFDATGDYCPHIRKAFVAGAEWQKQQMMKEAVEGEVVKDLHGKLHVKTNAVSDTLYHFGDKVKVLIIPEKCQNS